MKKFYISFIAAFLFQAAMAQTVTVTVNAATGQKPISPYIYGKNNNTSDNPGSPTTAAEWKFFREAGLRFFRENIIGG